jgi:CDP-glucose 4,6-dehydratase
MPEPAFWQGRRVWLTGHTGFKGAWLALWLQSLGAQVHGFSAGPVSEPSLYEVADVGEGMAGEIRGDVRSRSELRAAVARARPDVVIHMAAQALVRRGLEQPVETFAINVTGTAKVLDAVLGEASPGAVVVVTSDKCYRGEGPFREDDPLGGDDPYAASKAAQEHVAAAYRALGLPIATVRAGNVVGGGDWAPDRLVADCMRAALAGAPVAVRAPDSVRPWQHVLCPLDGYLTVAERLVGGDAGTAWNFGPDEERTVAWVVERLRERWPGGLDVRAAEPDAARGEAPVLRLDSTRARERLGWAPRWDLDAALDATVAWYAAYRDGADMRAETLRQIGAHRSAMQTRMP